jgi:hypothetical protein
MFRQSHIGPLSLVSASARIALLCTQIAALFLTAFDISFKHHANQPALHFVYWLNVTGLIAIPFSDVYARQRKYQKEVSGIMRQLIGVSVIMVGVAALQWVVAFWIGTMSKG